MVEKRAHWFENFLDTLLEKLLFIDESGVNTKMARLRGRAPIGERLVAKIPHGHWHSNTIISAIRLSGPCAGKLFDGSMNGEKFLAWVTESLVPLLQKDDIVVMDNLATHKTKGVREAIENVGARLLYLPPYSPDFNPIENMWSKIKNFIRSKAPRTYEDLVKVFHEALAAVSISDCQGFFSHAHYSI